MRLSSLILLLGVFVRLQFSAEAHDGSVQCAPKRLYHHREKRRSLLVILNTKLLAIARVCALHDDVIILNRNSVFDWLGPDISL